MTSLLGTLDDGTTIRLLRVGEGHVVGDAIRAAYGTSYDADWVYDAAEVDRRLHDGRLVSCVAESAGGDLRCHLGVGRAHADAVVGESGQAVTMPAARGQHLFTAVKRHVAAWARDIGMVGLFSEATTAHPFSQRANVELGAQETGFLLGWIPASVANDAATPGAVGRRAAAVFYLRTGSGHRRPVFAPSRHRDVVGGIVATAGLRGHVADAPDDLSVPTRSVVHAEVRADHNLALVTVEVPGRDLAAVVDGIRASSFADGLDALYVDLPLDRPETAHAAELVEDLDGLGFAGVFPNARVRGDVLRLQQVRGVTTTIDGIATASDHGRALLDYVLGDCARAG